MPDDIYDEPLPTYGSLIPVAEFRESCGTHCFVDYDGFGHPVKGEAMASTVEIRPSRLDAIPPDATHIMWFNK